MIQKLEALVRAGKFKEASQGLKKVKLSKVNRDDALAYAGIATRIGELNLALKILNPIVRGENLLQPASQNEKVQYGNLLRRLGALPEAVEILKEIDSELHADASLYLAFCYSTQWEYNEAIPHLRAYLKNAQSHRTEHSPYKIFVAKVNLLAALIHEESIDESRSLIAELLQELNQTSTSLLLGNVHELTAQLEIQCENWDAADQHLAQAASLLENAKNSADALYIEKWQAITESLRSGAPTSTLIKVQERALELHHWETVRDCEFYIAKLTDNHRALIHLFCGTPFKSYKSRVLREFKGGLKLPNDYLWCGNFVESIEQKAPDVFNLITAQVENGSSSLPPGQALHRLMVILSQDFYRPTPLVSLYSKLFPGEYFNPETSPNRTHQILKRLRKWLSVHHLSFEIQEIDGAFRLNLESGSAIRTPSQPLPFNSKKLELVRLQTLITANEFTAREAAETLQTSRSEIQRLLNWAIEDRIITVHGSTKTLRYKKVA
jgi:tetratricopeptide (TPR) repeat protein